MQQQMKIQQMECQAGQISALNVTSASQCRWDSRSLYRKNLCCTISQPQHKTGGYFVMPSKINIMLQSNSFYCCCSGEGFFKILFSFGFFGFSLWSFCWCPCWYFSDGGGNVLFIIFLIIKIYSLLILEISLINTAMFSAWCLWRAKLQTKIQGLLFLQTP